MMDRERSLNVAENTRAVLRQLEQAGERWGRPCALCAVTKTVDAYTINSSYDAGVRIIGENRVQEAMQKFPALNPNFALHIIGQLQSNKVKYILDFARMVHSLDRIELAREIDRRAQMRDMRMPVLIQLNIARESQKAGITEDELLPFARACAKLPGIHVQGLMAIMPLVPDPEPLRPMFRATRRWFERLRDEAIGGTDIRELSMGMSGDYLVAAQEGATMVRVGSRIYGRR